MRIAVSGATGRLGRLVVAERATGSRGRSVARDRFPTATSVIDVSTPDGLRGLLPRLSGQPLVVGTTGVLPDLRPYAARAPVLVTANFSAGVPLLLDLVAEAARRLEGWDVEIVETHHNQKRDAPSGNGEADRRRRRSRRRRSTASAPATRSARTPVGASPGPASGSSSRTSPHGARCSRSARFRAAEWIVGRPPGLVER
jgi:4-hydroxy-tetrahydrodipicolinate reductase